MNESALKTLLWVIRLGGIGAAAEHLHMTQPAITRRIQELEKELGAPVLRREGRRVVPTALGQTCLGTAERILSELAALRMAASGKAIAGIIRIGVGEVIALTWFHRLHARIAERYPGVRLEIDVDLSSRLLNKLLHDKIDIALMPGPTPLPGTVRKDLGSITLEWVASPKLLAELDLRGRGLGLSPADLASLPIVTLPHDANMHEVMIGWFGQAGASLSRLHSCNSINIVASLVKNGVGISLLPADLHKEALQAGTLVRLPVAAPLPKVGYAAVYTQNAGLSAAPELSILPDIAEFAREESWFLRKPAADGSIPWPEG